MAGEAPAKAAPRPKARRGGRAIGLAVAWTLMLLWLLANPQQRLPTTPMYGALSVGFSGLTLWGIGAAGLHLLRWAFSPGKARSAAREARGAERGHVVTACLPVPWSTTPVSRITAALPEYCQRLLQSPRGR
jgi:hypothetical protein